MSTIYIMWLRQLKRFWRSRSRVAASLAQPLLFLFGLGFGLGPVYAKAGGGDYIQFLAPGIISMTILFAAIFSGIEIIWDKQFGFLKETLVAPVSRYELMLGKTLGGATVALIQGTIIFAITFVAGFRPESFLMIPVAFLFMVLIAVLFTALGSSIAARMNDMQGFPLIMNFIIMPLFFLSGALFPIEQISKILSIIIRVNPLSYGVDGVRGALTGVYHFSFVTNFSVLLVVIAVFISLGAYQFSRIEI